MWQNLKPKKPNIATKQVSKPSVTIVVETHFELNTTTIEVDNQMAIIQTQVGKNILKDCFDRWRNMCEQYNIKP